ncbi:MAG TPA: FAD-dependent oxidoreductase [Polyangiaceae bacterium]
MRADVAVVGGGITGLTTALLLAEAGKRVVLLEGRRLGAGVTGATTAHLTEVVDTRYHRLASSFGRDGAEQVRASSRDAIELIAAWARAASLDCGFRRVNGFLFAADEQQAKELERELAAAEQAGARVEPAEVRLLSGARPAVRFADQAQLDQPLAYLAAIHARMPARTVQVFEQTPMVELSGSGPFEVVTGAGAKVVADAVVLATHSAFAKLSLQLKLAQYRSYVVAGRSDQGFDGLFWDLNDPYHYLRQANVGGQAYVIVGGQDHRTGQQPDDGRADAPYARLEDYAAHLGVPTQERWSSQVVESADGLPFIGRPDPDRHLYVATGFGGNGMTFGTLAAMLISDAILGRKNRYAELYRANRAKPLASLAAVVAENADTVGEMVAGHWHRASQLPLAELPIGVGRVVQENGERLAVYRDQDGQLHALSAICTHQGCQVAFNASERSWDCPCHGSRFDLDGRVLDGPATKPLERRQR